MVKIKRYGAFMGIFLLSLMFYITSVYAFSVNIPLDIPSGNITNEYINNTYINQTGLINDSYYLKSNPFGFYNETTLPATDLSNYYNKSTSDSRFCFANGTNCNNIYAYFLSPENNSVSLDLFKYIKFIIKVNSSVTGISYSGETKGCSDGQCSFEYTPWDLDLVEGENIVTFGLIINGLPSSETISISLYYYSDIQSLADATEEHNVKSTWLEDIKDWILDIARTLFYEKDSNINATGYNITADYYFGDGSQLTGIASGLPENVSIAGRLESGANQKVDKINSNISFAFCQSDSEQECFLQDGYTLGKQTSGTITNHDIMLSQRKASPSVMSCRVANSAGADCFSINLGRSPATSGTAAQAMMTDAHYMTQFYSRNKFWLHNATLGVGAIYDGEISASLLSWKTKAYGLAFFVDAVNVTSDPVNWTILCYQAGATGTPRIRGYDTGIPYENNVWYNLYINETSGARGFSQSGSSYEFFINGQSAYNCTGIVPQGSMYASMFGEYLENRAAESTVGQDIFVRDLQFISLNRFEYDDVWPNFNGGSSTA